MREILFRGKRIGDGEWVEGNLMTGTWYLDNRPITAISPVDDVFYPHYETSGYEEVITETVGQYTGLTANGKKIFEGDIMRYGKERGIVNYIEGCFCVKKAIPKGFRNNPAIDIIFIEYPNDIEIIGNVHDNPELLEE